MEQSPSSARPKASPGRGCRLRPRGLEARGGTETSLGTKDGGVGTCWAMGNADEPSPRLPGARGVPAWHFSTTNRALDRVPGAPVTDGDVERAEGGCSGRHRERPQPGMRRERHRLVASIGHRCINNTDKKSDSIFLRRKEGLKTKEAVYQPAGSPGEIAIQIKNHRLRKERADLNSSP